MATSLTDRAIYETVVRDAVPTRGRLWVATAHITDM